MKSSKLEEIQQSTRVDNNGGGVESEWTPEPR